MDRTFSIKAEQGSQKNGLTFSEVRRLEALFRAMRMSYVIIDPDGYKITCSIDKRMKVYIAGKVTGEPTEVVRTKFSEAERSLTSQGFDVVNPINLVNDPNCRWSVAMGICIAELAESDAIYLLSDWLDSTGARIEFRVAKELDLKIFFESKE